MRIVFQDRNTIDTKESHSTMKRRRLKTLQTAQAIIADTGSSV